MIYISYILLPLIVELSNIFRQNLLNFQDNNINSNRTKSFKQSIYLVNKIFSGLKWPIMAQVKFTMLSNMQYDLVLLN